MSDTNTAPPEYSIYEDQVDRVVQPLRAVSEAGYSRHRVYQDWLTISLAAVTGDDETYRSHMEKYTDETGGPSATECKADAISELFTEAYAGLTVAVSETQIDILGTVYELFSITSDEFGQFFTPWDLSSAKAEMLFPDEPQPDKDRERIMDPACGSGRLLVAAKQAVPDDVTAVCVGVDKDPICAQMTALNLFLFDIPGYAVHGDSLNVDIHTAWQTGPQDADVVQIREVPDPSQLESILVGESHSADDNGTRS